MRAYVTTAIGSISGTTVLVIDTATNTVVGRSDPRCRSNPPWWIAMTPDEDNHAYVANSFDGTVSVISTASDSRGADGHGRSGK